MTILDTSILGVVQGLAEFLPISSSGHLILARELFGVGIESLPAATGAAQAGGLAFDAVLQFATACAVVVYFRNDLMVLAQAMIRRATGGEFDAAQERLFIALVVATVPAIFIGLFLEDAMETVFRHGALVAGALLVGSLIMVMAERWAKAVSNDALTPGKSLAIGFFQALALIPGMSRSGMTIAGGMFLGLSRESAARFSFLLAIPILLGSGAKKMVDIGSAGISQADLLVLIVGVVAAFAVGLAVIHYLLRFLRTHSMMVFVWYRVALAAAVFVLVSW